MYLKSVIIYHRLLPTFPAASYVLFSHASLAGGSSAVHSWGDEKQKSPSLDLRPTAVRTRQKRGKVVDRFPYQQTAGWCAGLGSIVLSQRQRQRRCPKCSEHSLQIVLHAMQLCLVVGQAHVDCEGGHDEEVVRGREESNKVC